MIRAGVDFGTGLKAQAVDAAIGREDHMGNPQMVLQTHQLVPIAVGLTIVFVQTKRVRFRASS